eukprot:CAMPEP_0183435278 /NCGR_PEP_ID=MMETSP0370-20130417/67197_1 /TAXON_ID=268820 /ORGANISM="Peridinium aciculiferum, Strain PAER-2" /LENGTH=374 /DNA_ID=CAMNT_0025622307 /DNA_START=75 /DNA_END=1199 /DNA_ORIENTATION=-
MAAAADVALIAQVVKDLEVIPASARKMLCEGLPHAAEACAEVSNIHGMQYTFLNLIASALQDAKASAEKDVVARAAQGQVDSEELGRRAVTSEVAAEAFKAADAEVEAKAAAQAAAQVQAQVAEKKHSDAQRAGKSMAAAWQETRDALESATSATETVKVLVDGGCEHIQAKTAAVEEYLTGIKADRVLVAAATLALALQPEGRAPFDRMTAAHVAEVVEGKVAELTAKVAEVAPQEAEFNAEILGLWAIADCHRDAVKEADLALLEAQATQEAARDTLAKAHKDEKAAQKEMSGNAIQQCLVEEQIKQVVAALEAVERIKAGPPPAPPAVEEPEAMAASADAAVVPTEETDSGDVELQDGKEVDEPMAAKQAR